MSRNQILAAGAAVTLATIGVVLLDGDDAMADRTDIWLSSSVVVSKLELYRLPDGGCEVEAHASFMKQDGGTRHKSSGTLEVAGANRTVCLDLLNTKGPAIFRAVEGL